jgi:membrane protease YdiL (CAAX protease family)
MNAYLDLARQGKNSWGRYVLGVLFIFFMWQVLGALPGIIIFFFVLTDGNGQTNITSTGQFPGVEPVINFISAMLASQIFLAGICLAIRFIHHRPVRTLITPTRNINFGRIFQGFAVWFILSGLISLVEAIIFPGRYVLTLDLRHAFPFLFLAIILVPIQTSAEELFFRSYILQGIGLRLRNIWKLSIISGIIFMVPHFLNPEAKENYGLMGFYYFFIGAVMAYVTLRDGKLELALGLHAANNLFSVLIANYSVSAMPSPSLFTIMILDPIYSVSAAVIGLILFILISFRHSKRVSK